MAWVLIELDTKLWNLQMTFNGVVVSGRETNQCLTDSCDRDVFDKNWWPSGWALNLQTNNDFQKAMHPTTDVILQNIDGKIFALSNICRHRKAQIQTTPTGNRPLICPYHSWRYGDGGKLISAPEAEANFGLTKDQIGEIALDSFDLKYLGNLILIRQCGQLRQTKTSSIENEVGEILSYKDFIPISSDTVNWSCNWKLAVESALEVYHINTVHPQTFRKHSTREIEGIASEGCSRSIVQSTDELINWWAKVRAKLKIERVLKTDDYVHYFLYPNIAIGITCGTLISIQRYIPVDKFNSMLEYTLYLRKPASDDQSFFKVISQSLSSFNEQVLAEDQKVSESCQMSMRNGGPVAILGRCEWRIRSFHAQITRDFSGSTQNGI